MATTELMTADLIEHLENLRDELSADLDRVCQALLIKKGQGIDEETKRLLKVY